MLRDAQGKFVLKNSEHRSIRSLRLTDTTWTALGEIAASLSLTRADLLEQMVRSNELLLPSITREDKEGTLSNTGKGEQTEPSNTWKREEIKRLLTEVAHLHSENAQLAERMAAQPTLLSGLEAFRDRVLKSLKLGKQASGYKTAKSALNQFIELLRSKI